MNKRIRTWVLVMAVVLLGTMLPACSRLSDTGKTAFRFSLEKEPAAIDPNVLVDEDYQNLSAALFEGLTTLGENGEVLSGAAETWTVSKDGCTYTFHLADTYWNKGLSEEENTPPPAVTADDFVFGFTRAMQAGTDTLIRSVTAKDEGTLVVTLKQPSDGFLTRLADAPYYPCHQEFFESTEGRYGLHLDYLLSNGAFSLSRWNTDVSLTLSKNEYYRATETVSAENVTFVLDAEQTADALKNGNLDVAELTADEAALAARDGLSVTAFAEKLTAVWFNHTVSPLSSAEVRVALREAIEWSLIREAAPDVTAADGFVPPAAVWNGQSYRDQAEALVYTSSPATAKRHLSDGLTSLGLASCPTLTVLCADDEPSMAVARLIVQSWQKHLSVYFHLESVDADTLATRMDTGDYQLAIGSVTGGGADALACLNAFTSDSSANIGRISSVAVDRACRTAAADPSLENLQAAEAALQAECACIPLFFAGRYVGFSEGVRGIRLQPFSQRMDFRQATRS